MVEPFRKREITDKEVQRAERRIRDGQPIDRVCRLFRVSRDCLKRRIGEDKWADMLAESKTKRCLS